MNERGTLWIVPDESQILSSLFEKRIGNGMSHTLGMKEFVNTYKIDLDIKENDYHNAPCMIAEKGHLVVKSVDDFLQLIFYIPEVITDRQLEFIYNNQMEFSKFQMVGGYSMKYLNGDGVVWKTLHGINEIMVEINKKNIHNNIIGVKDNVR